MTANVSEQPECHSSRTGGPAGRRLAALIAGLALVAAVVLFYKLGDYRTLSSHEGYAIVPAREMLESGNWVVPRFGGLPRLRKPPLVYWVIAGSASLFGQLNEWTARLPAACSALLLAALVGWWAARWYGTTAGLGAALVQLTSPYVIAYGRKAEVDMLLCLLTTGALFLVADQPLGESRRKTFIRWSAVYALIALSWLAKFHYGPAMVLIVICAYFVQARRFSSFWNLLNPPGLLLLAAAVVIWPWLLLEQVPEAWQIWHRETLGRAVGDLGTDPPWYYVPHLFALTIPWTLLAMAAAPASWRMAWKRGDARERFLWVWLLSQLALATASADKHAHYLFAALPMLSLLAGRQLQVIAAYLASHRWSLDVRHAIVLTGTILVGFGIAAGVVANEWRHLAQPAIAIAAPVSLTLVAALWLLTAGRAGAAGLAAVASLLGCWVGINGWIMPGRDPGLQAARFARELRAELTEQRPVFAYGMGERNPVVFYLGSPVSRVESVDAVTDELTQSGRALVLAYEHDIPAFQQFAQTHVLAAESNALGRKHPPLVLVELELQPTPAEPSREPSPVRYAEFATDEEPVRR